MRLFAALVPPREVLDDVTQLAAGVARDRGARTGSPSRPTPAATPRGPRRRFSRRRGQAPRRSRPGPMLDLVPPVRMHVPIVKFGNLALTDVGPADRRPGASRPRAGSRRGCTCTGAPRWSRRATTRCGSELRRRRRRAERGGARRGPGRAGAPSVRRPAGRSGTELQLGTINERTTEAYLEQLLAALDTFESAAWWQVTFSLLIPIDLGPDKAPYRLHREISLGPAVAH